MSKKQGYTKIVTVVVAAIMALGIVLAPTAALAKNAQFQGSKDHGIFKITNAPSNKICRLVGLTATGKKQTKLTINKTYKLDENYVASARTTKYTVTRIVAKAFNGSKVKTLVLPTSLKKIDAKAFYGSKAKTLTIKLKSKNLTKAKTIKNAFKGSKAKKITFKVPKSKLSAYKKVLTKKNLGTKATIVVKGY